MYPGSAAASSGTDASSDGAGAFSLGEAISAGALLSGATGSDVWGLPESLLEQAKSENAISAAMISAAIFLLILIFFILSYFEHNPEDSLVFSDYIRSIYVRFLFHVAIFYAADFAGSFIFPADTHIKRMIELIGPALNRTVGNTRPAEPTLIGIHHDRRIACYGVWHQHVAAADLHAGITADAFALVKRNALVRCCRIGYKIGIIHISIPPNSRVSHNRHGMYLRGYKYPRGALLLRFSLPSGTG